MQFRNVASMQRNWREYTLLRKRDVNETSIQIHQHYFTFDFPNSSFIDTWISSSSEVRGVEDGRSEMDVCLDFRESGLTKKGKDYLGSSPDDTPLLDLINLVNITRC